MKAKQILITIICSVLIVAEAFSVLGQPQTESIEVYLKQFTNKLYGMMLSDSEETVERGDFLSIDGYIVAKVFETIREVDNINMPGRGITDIDILDVIIDRNSIEVKDGHIFVDAAIVCEYYYDGDNKAEWINRYSFTLTDDDGYDVIDVKALEGDWFLVARKALEAYKDETGIKGIEQEYEYVDRLMDAKKVNYSNFVMNQSVEDEPVPRNLCSLEGTDQTRSVTVSYNRTSAKNYAIKTTSAAYSTNYIFCPSDDDCTNFVSQCVWAGYGGTAGYTLPDVPTEFNSTIVALRNRVSMDYRMVPGSWYGRYWRDPLVPSPANWCGVSDFWDYAVGNTGQGPNATGFNDGKSWTQYSGTIRIGDVLQVKHSYDLDYLHSVIVTMGATDSTTMSNASSIYVTQHEPFYTGRVLTHLIAAWSTDTAPCYLRRMRFYDAVFSN